MPLILPATIPAILADGTPFSPWHRRNPRPPKCPRTKFRAIHSSIKLFVLEFQGISLPFSMNQSVATGAKGDEILFAVVAQMAPGLDVMDL